MTALRLGISPCPNDTFVFHAWVHGLVGGPAVAPPEFADIDVLNDRASAGDLDVVKVSYGALPWLLDGHRLLASGGAVGRGCGPLVLTAEPTDVEALRDMTIAVPGTRTTAYLLLRLRLPGLSDAAIRVTPFDQIMPAVQAGAVDAGLVIHESRFTYPDYGLVEVLDLGAWWEQTTSLPIPLGAIVAADRLGPDLTAEVEQAIRASVAYAFAHPEASAAWVREHAQEMDPAVAQAHIALYVNDFSLDLGDEGRGAAGELLSRAAAAGLTPPVVAAPHSRTVGRRSR